MSSFAAILVLILLDASPLVLIVQALKCVHWRRLLTVPQRACRSAWARLIAKVHEVDPLVCLHCGSHMKLIAVIADPSEVRKIVRRLLKTGRAPPGPDPSSLT